MSAIKSVNGWVLFVKNLHEEIDEEDLYELFADYGDIKNIKLNLDRETGFVKGYGLVEFEKYSEALRAIRGVNGEKFKGNEVEVDFCFKQSVVKKKKKKKKEAPEEKPLDDKNDDDDEEQEEEQDGEEDEDETGKKRKREEEGFEKLDGEKDPKKRKI